MNDETKHENMNKLVSKVYISAPTTPTSLIIGNNYFDVDKFNQNSDIFPQDMSSSFSYSATSDSAISCQSNTSLISYNLVPKMKRNVIVHLDMPTDLKIDMNFECFINNQTTCRDLISHIIRKANNLIHAYFSNAKSYFNDTACCNISEQCYKGNNESTNSQIGLLDENIDLYYLIVILNENQEKILMKSFLIASLRDPWSKGQIHLRKY
jgi:hypothetical protein